MNKLIYNLIFAYSVAAKKYIELTHIGTQLYENEHEIHEECSGYQGEAYDNCVHHLKEFDNDASDVAKGALGVVIGVPIAIICCICICCCIVCYMVKQNNNSGNNDDNYNQMGGNYGGQTDQTEVVVINNDNQGYGGAQVQNPYGGDGVR